MNTNIRSRKCYNHEQECIAVDIAPNCDPQNRHCCVKCLNTIMNQRSILSYEDAEQYLINQKKIYKCDKEIQNKRNLQLLEEINTKVIELKNFLNYQIEQLVDDIEHQTMLIDDSQKLLEGQLSDIDIDLFLSKANEFAQNDFHVQVFQKECKKQLEIINQEDRIIEILKELSKFDTRTLTLIPNEQISASMIKSAKQKMKFSFVCEEHNEEIRLFDRNEQTPKGQRIACEECIPGRQGPFTPLSIIYKQWIDCQQRNQRKIYDFEGKTIQKIEFIQMELGLLSKEFKKKIYEMKTVIEGESIKVSEKLQEKLSSLEKQWAQLKKEEVLDMIETFCQPQIEQMLVISFDEELQRQGDEMNQAINNCVNNLRKIERSFIENMCKLTNYDEKLIQEQNSQDLKSLSENECQTSTNSRVRNSFLIVSFQFKKQCLLSSKSTINLQYQNCGLKQHLRQYQIINLDLIKKPNNKVIRKKINYQIVEQKTPQNENECSSIAINKDSTIMIAGGSGNQINVFDFNHGQLRLIEKLQTNVLFIQDLYFMKKTNQFILGSFMDSKIQIWSFDGNGYKMIQEMATDTNGISRIIMNESEDLIISSSYDSTIKFWMKSNNFQDCFQTLKIHSGKVLCIALNESQNQLVSCGENKEVNISAVGGDKKWQLVQNIIVDDSGARVNFVGENIISFQLFNGNKLIIFEQNLISKQFLKSKEIEVHKGRDCGYFFEQKYIQKKSILCHKNGEAVNIFLVKNNQFTVEQTIHFHSPNIRGAISCDGEYLVIWDQNNKNFQVRKFQ